MDSSHLYAFETMRDVQVDIIEQIQEAFKKYKYVMLESPTGTGKSGILMSLALQYGESYINTSSKLLQDQYLRDFDFIKTIKGKNTFECINPDMPERYRDFTCDMGKCTQDSKYICKVKPNKEDYIVFNRGSKDQKISYMTYDPFRKPIEKRCHYYEQKFVGMKAGHTILNYAYFFSLFFYTDDLHSRNLLVFDEAHNIENQILDFISLNPNPDRYEYFAKRLVNNNDFLKKNVKVPAYPTNDKIESWIEYLKGTEKWMMEVQKHYEDAPKNEDISKGLADMDGTLKRISHVVSIMELDRNNWIIDIKTDFQKIKSVKISPIETGPYVKPIFEMGTKVLLASATLLDKEVFAGMIGIKPEEIAFIRLDESPFPKENRPIFLKNTGEMNYKTMEGLLPKITMEIDKILDEHPDERGIIHTTSYKQLEYILKKSYNSDRLVRTEAGIPQSDILTKANRINNAVLISPSMHEGVDLKDDLSRFQITVKIPYLDLSDKRTMIKKNRSPNWYQYYAILKFIQGIGRSIRNDKDHAVTYVLDSKASQIITNKMMPQYILEAIHK